MVKVYAVTLVLGLAALAVAVIGGLLPADEGRRFGPAGKAVIGALIGFGMGGLSAEFSPLDLDWGVSLAIALLASSLAVLWVRIAVRQAG